MLNVYQKSRVCIEDELSVLEGKNTLAERQLGFHLEEFDPVEQEAVLVFLPEDNGGDDSSSQASEALTFFLVLLLGGQ